jgi:hypothetical protein
MRNIEKAAADVKAGVFEQMKRDIADLQKRVKHLEAALKATATAPPPGPSSGR